MPLIFSNNSRSRIKSKKKGKMHIFKGSKTPFVLEGKTIAAGNLSESVGLTPLNSLYSLVR